MKPCEHCGKPKNAHQKRGRGRRAKLFCSPDGAKTYDQSKASFEKDFAAYWKREGPQDAPAWFVGHRRKWSPKNFDYVTQTKYGDLRVTFYSTWVATAFQDFERAKDFLVCNHSAKWNFHGPNFMENFRERLAGIL